MNDTKNIMITGTMPTGTFIVEVTQEEILDVDPRVLMAMEEKLRAK